MPTDTCAPSGPTNMLSPGPRRRARGARHLLSVLAAAAVLLTASCSSSGTSQPAAGSAASTRPDASGAQQITIDTTNMFRFSPATIYAHVGAVHLTLTEAGSYPHNLLVDALGITSATVNGNPGQGQTTVTLTFTHPGTYRFECTYHSTAGMTGQFIIR